MSFKAELKVILKADDTVVAESVDPSLWQNILVAINNGEPNPLRRANQVQAPAKVEI